VEVFGERASLKECLRGLLDERATCQPLSNAATIDGLEAEEIETVVEDIQENGRRLVSVSLAHVHFMEMVVEAHLVKVHHLACDMALSR
jgi:hypothetical protein